MQLDFSNFNANIEFDTEFFFNIENDNNFQSMEFGQQHYDNNLEENNSVNEFPTNNTPHEVDNPRTFESAKNPDASLSLNLDSHEDLYFKDNYGHTKKIGNVQNREVYIGRSPYTEFKGYLGKDGQDIYNQRHNKIGFYQNGKVYNSEGILMAYADTAIEGAAYLIFQMYGGAC